MTNWNDWTRCCGEIVPRPSITSERQAEISGRVRQAARVQLRNSDLMSVMGAGGSPVL